MLGFGHAESEVGWILCLTCCAELGLVCPVVGVSNLFGLTWSSFLRCWEALCCLRVVRELLPTNLFLLLNVGIHSKLGHAYPAAKSSGAELKLV